MNGPLGLAMNIDARPITSPSQHMAAIFESGQFMLSFAEVLEAVNDGDSAGNGDGNIEEDLLPLEIEESQTEAPEPVKPDLQLSVPSATQPQAPEIITEQQIGFAVPELVKVTDEMPRVEDEARQQEAAPSRQVTGYDHSRSLQADNPKAAPVISSQRELPAAPINNILVLQEPVPTTQNIIAKEIQMPLATGLVKPAASPQPEIVPLQDRSNSPLPSVAPPTPKQQAVLPAPIFSAPIVTAPSVSAPMPATAPAFPMLDIEAGSQWVAKLSQDIGQLSAEKPVLNFQLKPEHLGKLTVRITAGTAGDVVRLETENENVKALLIGSQGRLEQDIRLSGLKLARVDVTVQDHSGSQLGQQRSGSRENGPETGRNSDAHPQEYRAPQSPLTQQGSDVAAPQGTAAASPHHGARYA